MKWSKHIFDEWETVMIRKQIPTAEVKKRVSRASKAFPEAFVRGYESLIPLLELPDMADRHVLAAAIRYNADVIVTNNLSDFPNAYLQTFDIRATSPDEFLADVVSLKPQRWLEAFEMLVSCKKKPPVTSSAMLNRYRTLGLTETVSELEKLV